MDPVTTTSLLSGYDVYNEDPPQILMILGSKYVGQVRDGKPHGEGVLTFKNEGHPYCRELVDVPTDCEEYRGGFENGLFHGIGRLKWKVSGHYEGNFEHGHMSGEGRRYYADGCLYEGAFLDDLRHGYGVFRKRGKRPSEYDPRQFVGYTYKGGFEKGQKSGQGELTWEDGSFYKGAFLQDRFHGIGELSYVNRDYLGLHGRVQIRAQYWKGEFINGHLWKGEGIDYATGKIYTADASKTGDSGEEKPKPPHKSCNIM